LIQSAFFKEMLEDDRAGRIQKEPFGHKVATVTDKPDGGRTSRRRQHAIEL
jgi:hypothetical protein